MGLMGAVWHGPPRAAVHGDNNARVSRVMRTYWRRWFSDDYSPTKERLGFRRLQSRSERKQPAFDVVFLDVYSPQSSCPGWVFGMDETIQTQIARLSSDVQHIQTDVADMKVGLRRVEDRLDAVNGRIDGVNGNIYRLEEKLTDKIEATRSSLTERMESIRSEQADKTESVRSSLTDKIEGGPQRTVPQDRSDPQQSDRED